MVAVVCLVGLCVQTHRWRVGLPHFLGVLAAALLGFTSYLILKALDETRGQVLAFSSGVWGAVLLFFMLTMSPGTVRREPSPCHENLNLIAQAIFTYTLDNGEYFPFDERGPLHSLALLYPEYVRQPKAFRCPYARRKRWKRRMAAEFPADNPLAGLPCDYGYTWRVHPFAVSNFAIIADMPMNHARQEGKAVGSMVLYVDGHVSWKGTPFCSNHPGDNIYAQEPGWSPDTDSWIRQE